MHVYSVICVRSRHGRSKHALLGIPGTVKTKNKTDKTDTTKLLLDNLLAKPVLKMVTLLSDNLYFCVSLKVTQC